MACIESFSGAVFILKILLSIASIVCNTEGFGLRALGEQFTEGLGSQFLGIKTRSWIVVWAQNSVPL